MKIKTIWTRVRNAIAAAVLAVLGFLGFYSQDGTTQTPTWNVSLTLPSTYQDGSALAPSAITSYTIAYKVGSAATYTTKVVNGPFSSGNQSTTIPKSLGQTCVNAFVNVGAVTGPATSPDVCVANTGPPGAPTNLQVN